MGRNASSSLPPPRSLSRRIFSSPSVTWKRTDTDLPEFYVSKRVIVLVAGVSHALLAPFSITAAAILAEPDSGESVGDTRRPRIFSRRGV